jgi:hypothetical protein
VDLDQANDLETYFFTNRGRMVWKLRHYFEIYDQHFARFRDRPINVVEIGVWNGGSLQMWKSYFGERATIWGVDIDPRCKDYEGDRINVLIGDQANASFLRRLADTVGRIDVLIDDGGHLSQQQLSTFDELFPRIAPDGVYLCEDILTSYLAEYSGGYRKPDTFIERSKSLIDQLYAWHSESSELRVSEFTKSTHSIHFYNNVVVIEKRPTRAPVHVRSGAHDVADDSPKRYFDLSGEAPVEVKAQTANRRYAMVSYARIGRVSEPVIHAPDAEYFRPAALERLSLMLTEHG